MSDRSYDRRKAKRNKERERALAGETYGEYRERAKGRPRAKPGADLPHVRCDKTIDAFAGNEYHDEGTVFPDQEWG